MRALARLAPFAALAAASAAQTAAAAAEQAERDRLQAAHDATLRLELHGTLDPDALARGVHEVQVWWTQSGPAVQAAVDAQGEVVATVPAVDVRDREARPILHLVDNAGAHWFCAVDLAKAPPTGAFGIGGLDLLREPRAPRVTDDRGRPVVGARVLLMQGRDHPDFETLTDANGSALLCRASPAEPAARLAVRHDDFALWWGSPADAVRLDHGGEVCGHVLLPPKADAGDFVVGVWVEGAMDEQPLYESRFAQVTALIAGDGTFCLRRVPRGRQTLCVLDRNALQDRGPGVKVDVGDQPVTAPDLAIDAQERPAALMRLRFTDASGRAVSGSQATIWTDAIGQQKPLRNGFLDWVGDPSRPFGISVPGYSGSTFGRHRSGDTIRLQGGHRVSLRLALDCARLLPPGCALRAGVSSADGQAAAFESVLYPDDRVPRDDTALVVARDATVLVNTPGRYAVALQLVRWDAAARTFDSFAIDVEPREFEVRAGDERTLVTLSTRFVE